MLSIGDAIFRSVILICIIFPIIIGIGAWLFWIYIGWELDYRKRKQTKGKPTP